MARVEIPVTTIAPFMRGEDLTGIDGDDTNDMQVPGDSVKRLILVASNRHTSSVQFKAIVAQPSAALGFPILSSLNNIVPAIAGGVEGKRIIPLDSVALRTNDGVIHVDSTDVNFNLVRLSAYTWDETRHQ